MIKLISFLVSFFFLLGCSNTETFIYSYEEFDGDRLLFQEELHFYTDSTYIRYTMQPPEESGITRMTIYYPGFFIISGDTLISFGLINKEKVESFRHLLKGDQMIPITENVPQIKCEKLSNRSKKSLSYKLTNTYKFDSIVCFLNCYEGGSVTTEYVEFEIKHLERKIASCNDFDSVRIE